MSLPNDPDSGPQESLWAKTINSFKYDFTAAAVITAVAVGIAAIPDMSEQEVMRQPEDCENKPRANTCVSAITTLQRRYPEMAPQFTSLSQCEQLYGPGNCLDIRGSLPPGAATVAALFAPKLLGFLISRSTPIGPWSGLPLFPPRRDGEYAVAQSDNSGSSLGGGYYSGGYSTAASSTTARGGLGATGAAHGATG